ncbi:hypothetical protein HDV57DRAFT_498393 [Trichoderma longibrachiatum]
MPQNGSEHLADSLDADDDWKTLLGFRSAMSLDTEWARKQGSRPSARSPTGSLQSIYYMDVFHALHYLVRSHFIASNGYRKAN